MKLTGERPIEGKTPSGLLALHAAGYRAVVARLHDGGRLLDLGCGLGDGSANFLGTGRTVVGLDYHAETAAAAMRRHPGLVTTCADGTRLSLKSRSFDYVCSSHLIEHFTDPTPHVAELARVVADDGEVMVLTPNKTADFENPYHLYLFDPEDLFNMLGRHFHEVTVYGLDGDADVQADFEPHAEARRAEPSQAAPTLGVCRAACWCSSRCVPDARRAEQAQGRRGRTRRHC
jgi:SAM-dependent methyltransferase